VLKEKGGWGEGADHGMVGKFRTRARLSLMAVVEKGVGKRERDSISWRGRKGKGVRREQIEEHKSK
jgi:hypothetical protein